MTENTHISVLFYQLDSTRNPIFSEILKRLDFPTQERIGRIKSENVRNLKIVSWLLKYYALRLGGFETSLLSNIHYSGKGKPFIPGWKSFNSSDSESIAALATCSKGNIGIDIEKCIVPDPLLLEATMSPEEKLYLENASPEYFYTFWTRKEAVLKAAGTGLVDDLQSIDCTKNPVSYTNAEWYWFPIQLHNEYVAHVVSDEQDVAIDIHEVSFSSLIDPILSDPYICTR
jgi:4'-phosphopantetheinyl transferase